MLTSADRHLIDNMFLREIEALNKLGAKQEATRRQELMMKLNDALDEWAELTNYEKEKAQENKYQS